MRGVKKQYLPEKTCPVCNRPFTWRKKWEQVWDDVKYCSEACRKKRAVPIERFNETFPHLSQALAYVHLRIRYWLDGGDHWCVLCDVVGYKNLNQGKPLSLEFLKKKKIIRS